MGKNKLRGEQVKQMSSEDLQALAPVQAALATSASKLAGYRETLQGAYGDQLRLRVYSVVAVGYERLVWWQIGGMARPN